MLYFNRFCMYLFSKEIREYFRSFLCNNILEEMFNLYLHKNGRIETDFRKMEVDKITSDLCVTLYFAVNNFFLQHKLLYKKMYFKEIFARISGEIKVKFKLYFFKKKIVFFISYKQKINVCLSTPVYA